MDKFDAEVAALIREYESHPKDELLSKTANTNCPIIVFGAGAVGSLVAEGLRDKGRNVAAFCDNYRIGLHESLQLPILTPAQLIEQYPDAFVVVAADERFNQEIVDQVRRMGYPDDRIFRRYSGYELYDLDLLMEHYEGYKWAYEFFEDSLSKRIVLERMKGYLFHHKMDSCCSTNQYFDEQVIKLSDEEIFVDGGGFTGDTCLEFIRHTNGKYKFIYGFEPELKNFEQALKNLESYPIVEFVPKGLWHQDDVQSFSSESSSSKIVNTGGYSIALTSLDSFFKQRPASEWPTFIKLDIEGAEKQALIGAEQVIRRAHPKLAVCIYHKPEDIYELPRMLASMGEYKFSLRHYSMTDVETVLYAI